MELIKKKEHGFELETTSKMDTEYMASKGILICTCTSSVIGESDFMAIFQEIGEMVKQHHVKKLIFDKRSLKVFHQPSMEWYHIHWKKEMAKFGLNTYRKILPKDNVFQTSVEIGKKKIIEKNPDFNFDDYDIQYCNSVTEAILK